MTLATSLIPPPSIDPPWGQGHGTQFTVWLDENEGHTYAWHLHQYSKIDLKEKKVLFLCFRDVVEVKGDLVLKLLHAMRKQEVTDLRVGEGIDSIKLMGLDALAEEKPLPKRPPKKEENDEEDFA